MVPAVHFSSAGVAQVMAPVRGQLIHRVQVQDVFLAAAFAHFGSQSCLLLLHMQVTSCEVCMQYVCTRLFIVPYAGQSAPFAVPSLVHDASYRRVRGHSLVTADFPMLQVRPAGIQVHVPCDAGLCWAVHFVVWVQCQRERAADAAVK